MNTNTTSLPINTAGLEPIEVPRLNKLQQEWPMKLSVPRCHTQFQDQILDTLDEVGDEFIKWLKDSTPPKTREELRHDQLYREESKKKIDYDAVD